jgi:hypothetical protein
MVGSVYDELRGGAMRAMMSLIAEEQGCYLTAAASHSDSNDPAISRWTVKHFQNQLRWHVWVKRILRRFVRGFLCYGIDALLRACCTCAFTRPSFP